MIHRSHGRCNISKFRNRQDQTFGRQYTLSVNMVKKSKSIGICNCTMPTGIGHVCTDAEEWRTMRMYAQSPPINYKTNARCRLATNTKSHPPNLTAHALSEGSWVPM